MAEDEASQAAGLTERAGTTAQGEGTRGGTKPRDKAPWVFSLCAWLTALTKILSRYLWQVWVDHKRRVVISDWQELEFAPLELQAERQTVLAAVRQDWQAMEFASPELQDDREIAKEATNQNWRAMRFVSKRLKADEEILMEAVQQSHGWALEFASEDFFKDSMLLQEATRRLGGRLGLPLTPITTLVPIDVPDVSLEPTSPVAAARPRAVDAQAAGGEADVEETEELEQREQEVEGKDGEPEAEAESMCRSGCVAARETGETHSGSSTSEASLETPSAPADVDLHQMPERILCAENACSESIGSQGVRQRKASKKLPEALSPCALSRRPLPVLSVTEETDSGLLDMEIEAGTVETDSESEKGETSNASEATLKSLTLLQGD